MYRHWTLNLLYYLRNKCKWALFIWGSVLALNLARAPVDHDSLTASCLSVSRTVVGIKKKEKLCKVNIVMLKKTCLILVNKCFSSMALAWLHCGHAVDVLWTRWVAPLLLQSSGVQLVTPDSA